jgi:hypothetical protein
MDGPRPAEEVIEEVSFVTGLDRDGVLDLARTMGITDLLAGGNGSGSWGRRWHYDTPETALTANMHWAQRAWQVYWRPAGSATWEPQPMRRVAVWKQ